MDVLLAHAAGGEVSRTGEIVLTVFLVGVLVVIWSLLGVLCWVFWRAKKRDDAEKEAAAASRPWPSAPSS